MDKDFSSDMSEMFETCLKHVSIACWMFGHVSTEKDELLDDFFGMTILHTYISRYFENECTWEKRKIENQ